MSNTRRVTGVGTGATGQALPWVIEPTPGHRWPKWLGLVLCLVLALGLIAVAAVFALLLTGGGGTEGPLGAVASLIGGAGPIMVWAVVVPLALLAITCVIGAVFYWRELH